MNSISAQLKRRLLVALGIIVAIITVGGWWYFAFYTKSPDYSIQMIQNAIDKHDKDKFYKYVNVEHLLDTTSDDLLEGLVDSTLPMSAETKDAVTSLARLFKAPVQVGLKEAVDNYILYGTWRENDKVQDGSTVAIDSDMIVIKSGLPDISFRGIDSVEHDSENGRAVAKVRIYHEQAEVEFVLDVELLQNDDGIYQVYEITNFPDYVSFVTEIRQEHVKAYLEQSEEIIKQHEANAQIIEYSMQDILGNGSLGSENTREQLKAISENQMIPDWQQRKNELEALEVPSAAGSLHRLRLKICELRIEYYTKYAQWMKDKKAATLKVGEGALKQAKTLEKEAELLTRQVHART